MNPAGDEWFEREGWFYQVHRPPPGRPHGLLVRVLVRRVGGEWEFARPHAPGEPANPWGSLDGLQSEDAREIARQFCREYAMRRLGV